MTTPWHSTPDRLRRRPRVALCLPREVIAALPVLAGGMLQRGHYVERLVREDAARRGVALPGSDAPVKREATTPDESEA